MKTSRIEIVPNHNRNLVMVDLIYGEQEVPVERNFCFEPIVAWAVVIDESNGTRITTYPVGADSRYEELEDIKTAILDRALMRWWHPWSEDAGYGFDTLYDLLGGPAECALERARAAQLAAQTLTPPPPPGNLPPVPR